MGSRAQGREISAALCGWCPHVRGLVRNCHVGSARVWCAPLHVQHGFRGHELWDWKRLILTRIRCNWHHRLWHAGFCMRPHAWEWEAEVGLAGWGSGTESKCTLQRSRCTSRGMRLPRRQEVIEGLSDWGKIERERQLRANGFHWI